MIVSSVKGSLNQEVWKPLCPRTADQHNEKNQVSKDGVEQRSCGWQGEGGNGGWDGWMASLTQ